MGTLNRFRELLHSVCVGLNLSFSPPLEFDGATAGIGLILLRDWANIYKSPG